MRWISFLFAFLFPSLVFAGRLGPLARVIAHAAERGVWSPVIKPWHEDRGAIRLVARFTGDPLLLELSGAEILARVGRVYVLRAAPEALSGIARVPGLIEAEVPVLLEPQLDLSTPDTGAPLARELFLADGAGALVGIIDTGLDVFHPDFRHPDGSTRVLYFLDLRTSPEESGADPVFDPDGTQVFGFGGTVYDAAQLNKMLATGERLLPRDANGHGTHVAGIAASGGLATAFDLPAGRYLGVAPGADILVVDADRNFRFSEADMIAAVSFLVERAKKLGRPIAINLSIGGQSGAHDGTSALEEVFQELAGPGKEGVAIVVSAGNDGARDIHAGGILDKEAAVEVFVPAYLFQEGSGFAFFELWSDLPSDISISLESPNGEKTRPVRPGEFLNHTFATDGAATISNAPDGPDEAGAVRATIVLQETSLRSVAKGTWTIRLTGDARRFDLWMTASNLGATRLASHLDPDRRISFPGTGAGSITVASYITRNSWVRPNGEEVSTGRTPGEISRFSSPGPNRSGLIKPDISAPGEFILSALSQDAPPTSPASAFFSEGVFDLRVGDDGLHGALQGTSMAAPHVTGALAVLLGLDPSLDLEEMRILLQTTARCDEVTTCALPNTRWGFGKLDVDAAARVLMGEPPGALSLSRSSVGVSYDILPPDGISETEILIIPRDETGIPLGPGHQVTLEAEIRVSGFGELVGTETLEVTDLGNGIYLAKMTGRPPEAPGQAPLEAILTATVDGTPLPPRPHIFFVFDRSEIGRPTAGGCAVAPGSSGNGVFWAFLLGLFLLKTYRRPLRFFL